MPSIYEPFGLVALEAMASGCPCIVADTGGLREVVPDDEAGLRFRARDPEALADVAVRVLRDDELGRRLVAEAYEHIRRFDWADVAERRRPSSTRARRRARPRLSGDRPATVQRSAGASGDPARPGRASAARAAPRACGGPWPGRRRRPRSRARRG